MADFPEIPGCKILSVLGEGGMVKVYLGIEENLDQKVAVKVLELLDIITESPVISLPQSRESKKITPLDTDEKPLVKPGETLSQKYLLKKKLEIVLLGILVIMLAIIILSRLNDIDPMFSGNQKTIWTKDYYHSKMIFLKIKKIWVVHFKINKSRRKND